MELTYWRVTFTTGQEFIIESDVSDRAKFLKHLENTSGGLFSAATPSFFTLKKADNSEPIDIRSDKLFSVQKTNDVSPQTKKWKLV